MAEDADLTDNDAHSRHSSYREKMLEHRFVSEVLQAMWLQSEVVDVLKAEVDGGGFDLVLQARGVMRHVQLKTVKAGERQRPETQVLRIFALDDAGREAVVQLHRLITDRRLHLVDGVPKLVTEDRALFDGLRNVSVFVEGPEFDLSMVLVGSATWYGSMGVCSLDGFVIATLDAMTHDSLIMALESGAPQPVERGCGKTGAAYMPPWTADLPVLLITRDMKDTQARLDQAWSQLMP